MRPVRRRASPRTQDFEDHRDALPDLVSRLGSYCSYCERRIATQLAVEHIQPKGLPKYASLAGRWENFLLACVNCNSTKKDKDVNPTEVFLPDRDNTFAAFSYQEDGTINPCMSLSQSAAAMAGATLDLVGLDKPGAHYQDENGRLVALDRVNQRMEAWAQAEQARQDLAGNPQSTALREMIVRLAVALGFFSIWMAVFRDDEDARNRLIDAFSGTRESGCFDPQTTAPMVPAPNPDALPGGGKL